MANAWMMQVKAVRKQHPKKSLKEVLKMASKLYKKTGSSNKVTKSHTAKKAKKVGAKKGKTQKNGNKGKKGKKGKKSKSRGRK